MTELTSLLADLADTLHSIGYDQIEWMEKEFEGWHASLSHEPDGCLCEHKVGCFCCDPVLITGDMARYLAQNHSGLFAVDGKEPS